MPIYTNIIFNIINFNIEEATKYGEVSDVLNMVQFAGIFGCFLVPTFATMLIIYGIYRYNKKKKRQKEIKKGTKKMKKALTKIEKKQAKFNKKYRTDKQLLESFTIPNEPYGGYPGLVVEFDTNGKIIYDNGGYEQWPRR